VSIREVQYKFVKSKYAISTNIVIRKYMNNTTLLMVGILGAVAILSAALVVLPTQEANAERKDNNGKYSKYSKDGKYSKDSNDSYDGNDGGDGANTEFSFEQDQKNKCSGSAICTNDATITFSL
jgi:predicted outer membrane repeat protein